MKTPLIFVFILICLSCNRKREGEDDLERFTWMEINWDTESDNDSTLKLKVINYFEIDGSDFIKIAQRDSFDGPLKYGRIAIDPNELLGIKNILMSNNFDSTYLYNLNIDSFLYCGHDYYLNYKIRNNKAKKIFYIPPKAPNSLEKINDELLKLISQKNIIKTEEFPVDKHSNEIIKNFGKYVELPKVKETFFLPPVFNEDD